MQGKKAHSKHTWNTPARLYYNFPASVLILDVCIQNQQAKQEDWPQLFSYNVQDKRDLLALLVAVRGRSLQYCTITFVKYARLKSCKVRMLSQHGTAWREHIRLCTKRSKGKNYYAVLTNSSRNFYFIKVTECFPRSWNKKITIIFLAAVLPESIWCWASY